MSDDTASLMSATSSLSSLEDEQGGINGKSIQQLLREVEEALEVMDNAEKREYETAKEIVPNLVTTETPLLAFLRTDTYNPPKAATRLALYWKYRKEYFGERWLLPMTQTGRGALTLPEIWMLRTGFMHIYPVARDDFVCVLDYSRLTTFMEHAVNRKYNIPKMLDRVCMYFATVATNHWACQTRGLTYLHVVNAKKRPLLPFREEAWKACEIAFPCKVRRTVVADAYEKDKKELLQFVRFQTSAIVQHNSQLPPTQVYADSVRWTLDGLWHRCGLPKGSVPDSLGGNYCMDAQLADWTRTRIALEEFTGMTPTIFDVATRNNSTLVVSSKGRRGPEKERTGQLVKRKRDQLESETDFNKRRNAIYSRRLYHKRKLEILSLQEEVSTWECLNNAARNEMKRLEQLSLQAQALVSGSCAQTSEYSRTLHQQLCSHPMNVSGHFSQQYFENAENTVNF